jgi:hypothetical protein
MDKSKECEAKCQLGVAYGMPDRCAHQCVWLLREQDLALGGTPDRISGDRNPTWLKAADDKREKAS